MENYYSFDQMVAASRFFTESILLAGVTPLLELQNFMQIMPGPNIFTRKSETRIEFK